MRRIVILGAGTGGTIMANRVAKAYRGDLAAGEMDPVHPAQRLVDRLGLQPVRNEEGDQVGHLSLIHI